MTPLLLVFSSLSVTFSGFGVCCCWRGVLRLASLVMAILFIECDHINFLLYCIIQGMHGHVWAIYESVICNFFTLEM